MEISGVIGVLVYIIFVIAYLMIKLDQEKIEEMEERKFLEQELLWHGWKIGRDFDIDIRKLSKESGLSTEEINWDIRQSKLMHRYKEVKK